VIAHSTAPVTAELLERIAADPDWLARVLVAAGCAFNILDDRTSDRAQAHSVLGHAFNDLDAIRDTLAHWPTIADLQAAEARNLALQGEDS
jgi:hypothetical protein